MEVAKMKLFFISNDWDAVLQELKTMSPGKLVVYGWYYSYLEVHAPRKRTQSEVLIRDRVHELSALNQIMCFHVKLRPPVYPIKRTALVAYGVNPSIKLRLEAALERFALPKLEKT
jgi:hypothetical protein